MRTHSSFRVPLCISQVILGIAICFAPTTVCAQQPEIVQGRVLDVQKKPVAGVQVTIVGATSRATQETKTNDKGAYVATFRETEDTYALSFRKVGYGPYSRTIKQSGLSNIITVPDAVLPNSLTTLKPMVVTSIQRVPAKGEFASVGSNEMNVNSNAQFLADAADLNALIALLPGIHAVGDSGYSVLGAPPTQNGTTIDGASFSGGALPRDAISRSKVVTSTYDVSKGQFSGAQNVISLKSGSQFTAATLRTQLTDPHLAWNDPQAPSAVPQIAGASGYATGPIRGKNFLYIVSFDVTRRLTDVPSLVAPRAGLLSQLGISSDTVATALQTFNSLGIPATAGNFPTNPVATRGTATARVDYKINSTSTITFEAIPNWTRSSASGIGALSLPTSSGTQQSSSLWMQLQGSTYSHRVLEDFHVTLNPSSVHSEPFLSAPSGNVRVETNFADGRSGLSSFRFGGSGGGKLSGSSNSINAQNTMSWATTDTRHQLKFSQEVRADWGRFTQAASPGGVYSFQSLSALATNTPASFSRTLSTVTNSNHARMVVLSLGDIWRVIPGKLEFQGGVRYDRTSFPTKPSNNSAVESLYGVRTDVIPLDQGFSPRLGFSFAPKARRNGALPVGMTIIAPGLGGSARGGLAPKDASGLSLLPPGSDVTIMGGFGAYRGTIGSTRIGALTDATGLPGTTRYLSCVGSATPIPVWTANAASPDMCLDGAGPTLSTSAPRVNAFDENFHAPVSWRGALQVNGLYVHSIAIAPSLTYSLGRNAESWVDLNLNRVATFDLPDEGGRVAFGTPNDVVPLTGFYASGAARISSGYGRVTRALSDLRYHAMQITVPIVPAKPIGGRLPVYFVYSLNTSRAQQRGFSGTTAGDPTTIEWMDGRQSRHQFTFGASNVRVWWLSAGVRVDVLSGAAYTPMVAQDINGDGQANDRAFVPGASGNSALAGEMQTLLASAPRAVRRCLEAQTGTVAANSSCHTRPQVRLDLDVALVPPQTFGNNSRFRVTTRFLNAGGALVRLLGLQKTPLGQTASSASVDSRLLTVTGFDPSTRAFKYRVNQLFGQPVDYGQARHRYPPFQLMLGLEYRFGYPATNSTPRNLGLLQTGKDSAALAIEVRTNLMRRSFGPDLNEVARIIALRDTLGLSVEQVTSIRKIATELDAQLDSLFAPVVAFVISRGKNLSSDEYNAQTRLISQPLRDLQTAQRVKAVAFLLPEQRILLSTITRIP